MIGFYNYTVILTYIGTFFGFLGITYIWSDNLKASLIALLVVGFCDMFDGKVASTMKRTKNEKKFGVQIDSLSALICLAWFNVDEENRQEKESGSREIYLGLPVTLAAYFYSYRFYIAFSIKKNKSCW